MKKEVLKVEIDLKYKLFDQSIRKAKKKKKSFGGIMDCCVEERPVLKLNEIVKDFARPREKKKGIEEIEEKIQESFNSGLKKEPEYTEDGRGKVKLKSEKVLNLMIKEFKEKTESVYGLKKKFWRDVKYQIDKDFEIIHQNFLSLSKNQSNSLLSVKNLEIKANPFNKLSLLDFLSNSQSSKYKKKLLNHLNSRENSHLKNLESLKSLYKSEISKQKLAISHISKSLASSSNLFPAQFRESPTTSLISENLSLRSHLTLTSSLNSSPSIQ